jgi:hypothetical protein
MKHIISFPIFLFTTVIVVGQVKLEPPVSSNANFLPTIKSLEGAWVVTAVQRDDFGGKTRWMSEWIVKGSGMVANYKDMTAMIGSNNNWQVRNFRNSREQITFQIVQNSFGTSTTLNIVIDAFDEPVLKGHYTKIYDAMGYKLSYTGAIELRPIAPMYMDSQIVDKLVGSWLNQGNQNSELQERANGFNNRTSIYKDNGWLVIKYDGKDLDNIPITVTWFVTYLKQVGDNLRMVAYSPKGWCSSEGCGVVVDYNLKWINNNNLAGTFKGISAKYVVYAINGNVEYIRR